MSKDPPEEPPPTTFVRLQRPHTGAPPSAPAAPQPRPPPVQTRSAPVVRSGAGGFSHYDTSPQTTQDRLQRDGRTARAALFALLGLMLVGALGVWMALWGI